MLRLASIGFAVFAASSASAITIDANTPSIVPLPIVTYVTLPQSSGAVASINTRAFHLGINAELLRHPNADNGKSSGVGGLAGGSDGGNGSTSTGTSLGSGSGGGGGGGGSGGGGGGSGGSAGQQTAAGATGSQPNAMPSSFLSFPQGTPDLNDTEPTVTGDLDGKPTSSPILQDTKPSPQIYNSPPVAASIREPSLSAVPLPASLPLSAAALVMVGLAGAARRAVRRAPRTR